MRMSMLIPLALAMAAVDPFAPQGLRREAAGLPEKGIPKAPSFPPEALAELEKLHGKEKKRRVKELLAKYGGKR